MLLVVASVDAAWAQRAAEPAAGPTVGPSADAGDAEHDPPVPSIVSGTSPREDGVRVALVDSGVNYTLPDIAGALARHPDGTLVGHDFHDLDARPFDRFLLPGGRIVRHGTRTASVLIDEAPLARLVPYRFPQPDMTRMTALVEHAARNGVRVVGLPLGGPKREPWVAFERAARAHPDILFVASAGNDGRDIDVTPIWPAAFTLDNLVVVTSADDFGALAGGVNRGRTSVDYLVPAEHVPVLRFDGSSGHAAGSSYAVPRVVALAARLFEGHPAWRAPELVAELRRRFADGSHPREVGEGFIVDPLAPGEPPARIVAERAFVPADGPAFAPTDEPADASADAPVPVAVRVPLDVIVPNDAWERRRIDETLDRAASILAACAIALEPVRVRDVDAPARLADLTLGGARTLLHAVRASGPERRATVVLARDTRMRADVYDGEAFGRGNTRHRPWLSDSVWLTAAIDDAGIALAHELFHLLVDSGAHDPRPDNLMQARTAGDNTRLDAAQCEAAHEVALANGLAHTGHP